MPGNRQRARTDAQASFAPTACHPLGCQAHHG